MLRNDALRPSAVAACSIAILCCSVVARAQSVDPNFDPGANQIVNALAVQPDGRIVVGGSFTGLGGGTGTTTRNRIGRLNVNGTVEAFNPGTNGPVLAVAVQPDGKILAGGNFSAVGGGTGLTTVRNHIARFNGDGTVDMSFNPGANLNVHALAVQPDGKILVGGDFSMLGGGGAGTTPRQGIGRLNADGSIDTLFNPGASKSGGGVPIIYTIALQADGKIVVGGYFNGLGGGGGTATTPRNYIGRINADGTLDTGFNPGASSISGINALAIQADGKILVGGSFTGLGAGGGAGTTPRSSIGRINADGSVDVGFNPGAEAQVLTLALQADGKIIVGGYFKWLGAAGGPTRSVRNYIGRLNVDGSVDAIFNPGAGNVVNTVVVQADGATVAGGVFLSLGGGTGLATARSRIGRLSSPGQVPFKSRDGDFDGDGKADFTVFRPSTGFWYTLTSNSTFLSSQWGGGGDIPVTGDYDGDGNTDLAVFRPFNGTWYILRSATMTGLSYPFGVSTDIPVPADYDGDGKTDIAVFRPSTGTWYILKQGTLFTYMWGVSSDIPVPGDYDGDGKADVAVFRPSTGTWYILQSQTASVMVSTWGGAGDKAVQADYDGDGKADLAVYRPSSGTWYILRSATSTGIATPFGISTDIPVPGDYDGDGKTDVAIFRPSSGVWYVLLSGSNAALIKSWGVSTDIPILRR